MVHPYTYTSGRVAKAPQVVLSGQMLPGAWTGGSAGLTLGKGFAIEGTYGYTGSEVTGGGFELTRVLIDAKPRYLSFSAGADWFENDKHDYHGHRIFFGPTFSWYPADRRFGLHFPIRAYYMDYHWGTGWDESSTSEISDATGIEWLLVPGVGMSLDYSRVTVHLAINAPTVQRVDKIEIYPYVGVRLSLKLGRVEKQAKPPDEFSSR